MKLREIKAKSIITKTGLPDSDYIINPYVGCTHTCIYCYAQFMKKYTKHKEPWGQFLDVKINAPDLIPKNTKKYKGKTIGLSSVTDPYLPAERKYRLTRRILEKLLPLEPDIWILTKSDLVLRDIDLIKKFKSCIVTISLSLTDDSIRKETEPFALPVERRIAAVKQLKKAGIRTAIFISPILPEFIQWKSVVEKTKDFVDEFWFENLNMYSAIMPNIEKWLKKRNPDLLKKYEEIRMRRREYWNPIEREIKEYGRKNNLHFKIYFHH